MRQGQIRLVKEQPTQVNLQVILLVLAIIYLWIRHFDFKKLPIGLKWSVLFWVSFIFAIMDFFADMVSTLSGQYNYFSPQVLAFISPIAVLNKFLALLPNLWLLPTDCFEKGIGDSPIVFIHALIIEAIRPEVEILA